MTPKTATVARDAFTVSGELIDLYQTLRYGLEHPLSNALSGAIVDGLQHIRHGRVDRAARVVDEVRAALRA